MIALGESPSGKKSALEFVKVLVTTLHIWKSGMPEFFSIAALSIIPAITSLLVTNHVYPE